MADAAFRPLQRLGDAAGDGDMIVLDQHGVVEAEPMIAAAADADRVFLDRAQTRRGLARADDLRLGVADRRDHGRRRRRDSAQTAQEIQRDPLRRQNAARRAGDGGDHVAGRERRAIVAFDRISIAGSISWKASRARSSPATTPGWRATRTCRGAVVGRHDRVGRQIAGAAEIFEQAPCEPEARS